MNEDTYNDSLSRIFEEELEEDKNREMINDMIEDGSSNCCGASVINGICMACKEHCEVEKE
ncbi:MAG: hypothetical protein WC055_15845 [Melioribacteraceae bacterium]